MRIVGHLIDIAVAVIFVESRGNAKTVFKKVSRSKFAEDVGPVPIIPFVHGDTNIFALEFRKFLSVSAMRVGDTANVVGDLLDVLNNIVARLDVEMFANQVHVIGAFTHDELVPCADRSNGNKDQVRIKIAESVSEFIMLKRIFVG